jgi:hypothetical protein
MSLLVGGQAAVSKLRTNTLTCNLFGRLTAYSPGADYTCNVQMELMTGYLGIRIGIPNISANAVPNVKCAISAGTGFNASAAAIDVIPAGGSLINLTFGGAASVTLTPRVSTNVPSFTWSDLIPVKSLTRADGGILPTITVRAEYPSGSDVSVPQNGSYNWRGTTSKRQMRSSTQAVLGVTTPSAYTSNVCVDLFTMIPAVQYVTLNAGQQVLSTGDSIEEGYGQGAGQYCLGAVGRACLLLSTPTNPIEHFNAGQSGQAPLVYSQCISSYTPQISPTAVIYSPYSINDVPAGGMNATAYANLYTGLNRVLAAKLTSSQASKLLLLEALPCNPVFRATAAGDQLRRDLNAWMTTLTGTTCIAGYAAAYNGTAGQDGNGQTLVQANLTIDGAHGTELGYDTLAIPVRQYIAAL